jgi:hypothetical protein
MARKLHRWKDVRDRALSPERRAANAEWVERELLEMELRELREASGKTQIEAAALLETTQSQLSKVERRGDHRLSTLRKYVEALGGELEIIANFGDRRIRLKGV